MSDERSWIVVDDFYPCDVREQAGCVYSGEKEGMCGLDVTGKPTGCFVALYALRDWANRNGDSAHHTIFVHDSGQAIKITNGKGVGLTIERGHKRDLIGSSSPLPLA